jgi:ABC-type phosphate/phosphonate transport system substrate-binding protein
MGKKLMSRVTAIVILSLALACAAPAFAANKYVLDVPIPQGLSAGSLEKMLTELCKVLSKRVGVEISVKELKYPKGSDEEIFMTTLKDIKAGKADMALVAAPLQYAKHKSEMDAVATPFLTLTLNNKTQGDICGYVRKESPYKSISDLKGKTWGGITTAQTRYFMFTKGINSTMKEFFGARKFIDDTNITSPLDQLLAKNVDVYFSPSYIYEMAKGGNKRYSSELRSFGCVDFEHSWFFVYRKSSSKDVMDKIKSIMVASDKDKDFKQFMFMLAAIKGKFVPYSASAMATTEKVGAAYKKNPGWEKEQTEFIKNKK